MQFVGKMKGVRDDDSDGEEFCDLNGNSEGWIQDEDEVEHDDEDIAYQDESDGSIGEIEDDETSEDDYGGPMPKRISLKKRLVNSLDKALDATNYDPYIAPIEKKSRDLGNY